MTAPGTVHPGLPRWLSARLPPRVSEHLSLPLYRNGYALMAATGAGAALGAVYWAVAANQYSTADVGRNSALIASMTFLANLAHLNLTNGLNRFVPTSGSRTGRLIGLAYLVGGALSIVAALVYVLGIELWSPDLTDLVRQNPLAVGAFVLATVLWVVFQLEDSVLIGLGRADWVLTETAVFGVLKIVLLVALATALPDEGIFASWALPLLVVVVPLNVLIFRRLVPRHVADSGATTEPLRVRDLGRFVTADYFASLLWTATTSLMPLVVLAVVGPEESAYFFLSFTVAYMLYLLSRNLGMSLVTEGARAPQRLYEFALRTLAQSAKIVVPLAILVALASPLILWVLGPDYVDGASVLMPLLVLSAIPHVVITTFLSAARVQRRMRAVVVVTAAMSISVMALSIVLLLGYGLDGVGVAWLVAQSVVAVGLLLTELRAVWLPRVPFHRLPHRTRTRTDADDAVRAVLNSLTDWEPAGGARADCDVGTVEVRRRGGDDIAVLRFAGSDLGSQGLLRHRDALVALEAHRAAGDWDILAPRVLATGDTAGLPWVIETRIPGSDARDAARRVGAELVAANAAEAIVSLHRASAAESPVDDAVLRQWVDDPIDELRMAATTPLRAGADQAALDRLRAQLRRDLSGRVLTTCFVHGDFWLGNVLATDDGTITGIVDWERAGTPGLATLDVMTLILTGRVEQRRRELGPIVRDLLRDDELTPAERALLAGGPDAGELPERTVLLLAWLHHAASNLQKRRHYRASTIWVTTNVEHVLETV
jgi:O-antigen/teichoic acid export membrane protein/aminoglycoside phosphotransferase (APT) family kinase protein